MTSRVRVLTAFAHVEPDIVPRWCGTSPKFLAKARRQLNLPGDESPPPWTRTSCAIWPPIPPPPARCGQCAPFETPR